MSSCTANINPAHCFAHLLITSLTPPAKDIFEATQQTVQDIKKKKKKESPCSYLLLQYSGE